MTLKKLVESPSIQEAEQNLEKARQDFIKGGGLVPSDKKPESASEWIKIGLRIKKEAVMQIDDLIGDTMGLTRTGWILQAIEKELRNKQ